jgi:threonine/homoserine/homoserine lactone efflux protein
MRDKKTHPTDFFLPPLTGREDCGKQTGMTDPALFLIAVLALLATPGPTNTLLATAGATVGAAAAWRLPLAETAAYLIAVMGLGWGLGPLTAQNPALAIGLRFAAGLYLAFLAVKLWRGGATAFHERRAVSPREVFIATLFNPKGLIFAFGLIPMNDPAAATYLAAFAIAVATVGAGWVCLGAALRRGLSPERLCCAPRAAALALSGFSAMLIASPFLAG